MKFAVSWLLIGAIVTVTVECWPNRCPFRSLQARSVAKYRIVSYIHRTTTSCFVFLRCTKYIRRYKSEVYYSTQSYSGESIGNCYGYCSNWQCFACRNIDHCIDRRCTSSNNQHCLKCEFDRGGYKKAYDLVQDQGIQNRKCEQRCSWRPDSKFCYPGSCPGHPSTCSCLDGFQGYNCLSITEKPKIKNCYGKLKVTGSDENCAVDCVSNNVGYCQLNVNSFQVDWTSSYKPSLDSIYKPYYVNETAFGVVSAAVLWNLAEGKRSLANGTSTCLSDKTGIMDITTDDLPVRACSHVIDLHPDIKHNDRLSVQFHVRNGGFIKLNNFDLENSVTIDDPRFYDENSEEKTSVIAFDFLPPLHTVCGNVTDCSPYIMDIGDSYTTNAEITIRWQVEDWIDEPSGIDHYDCEAFRLTYDTSEDNLLDMRSRAPHASKRNIDPSQPETTLHLPDPGVYAIIMTVYDRAKNSAKVRRFVVFDDISAISIDVTKSIKADGAVHNKGVFWINPSIQQILSWGGHFYNSFHRDEHLLNGIAEHEPWPRLYDEVTGQPPTSRSREAIPNSEGIVFFQIDYAMSSSGRSEPQNWTDIGGMTEVPVPPLDSDDKFVMVSDNKFVMVWLRAHDVIGHTKRDSIVFYFDSTQPVISELEFVENSEVVSMVKTSNPNPGVIVKTHDEESGILEIQWKLYDRTDFSLLYGEGTVDKTSPTDPSDRSCSPLTCACIPNLNICSYLEYLVVFNISALDDFPDGKTECTVFITVVNNANMHGNTIEMQIEIDNTPISETSKNTASVAAGSITAVLLLLGIVVVIVVAVLYRRRRAKQMSGRTVSSNLSNLASEENAVPQSPQCFGIDNVMYQSSLDSDTSRHRRNMTVDVPGDVPPELPPKVNSRTSSAAATAHVDRKMRTREQIEISSTELTMLELLKPGIQKAKMLKKAASGGYSTVVVKCLKDSSSKTQKENLLNELDVMLSTTAHVNVIELLGCIINTGSPRPCIILEYAPYGSLKDVLSAIGTERSRPDEEEDCDDYSYLDFNKTPHSVTGDELMSFADQIACGLEHLASLKIIHRKLGIRNIFVGEEKVCKIGSFSNAVRTDKEEIKDSLEGLLPLRWMAPESLGEGLYSLKTDVWTFGVMLWEIITLGETPYSGVSNRDISDQIISGRRMEKPQQCTEELYSLMLLCWDRNPQNRPSMTVALRELRYITKNGYVFNQNMTRVRQN
ncbi:uncharacterized protein [Ptychodera flava]|uniref:uncharacterized protein n=1 Tax=Ptychodera flava TaxID=63121 RepID=UPI00396A67FB